MNKKKILLLIVFTLISFITYGSNVYAMVKVSCGNVTNIPQKIPELTHYVINLLQVAVPVILVIFGSIDLFKGIMASKEDEIKKGQSIFIKRLIIAIVIFFVVAIVKLFVSMVNSGQGKQNIVDCIDCFISNKCTNIDYVCTIDDIQFVFSAGELIGVRDSNGQDLTMGTSDFSPSEQDECPTSSNAYVDKNPVNGDFIYSLKVKTAWDGHY